MFLGGTEDEIEDFEPVKTDILKAHSRELLALQDLALLLCPGNVGQGVI